MVEISAPLLSSDHDCMHLLPCTVLCTCQVMCKHVGRRVGYQHLLPCCHSVQVTCKHVGLPHVIDAFPIVMSLSVSRRLSAPAALLSFRVACKNLGLPPLLVHPPRCLTSGL